MFDLTKQYVHFEDNEDGTMTMTARFKDLPEDVPYVTVVMEGNLVDLVAAGASKWTEEEFKDLYNKSTFIPNSPDDEPKVL